MPICKTDFVKANKSPKLKTYHACHPNILLTNIPRIQPVSLKIPNRFVPKILKGTRGEEQQEGKGRGEGGG